MFSSKRLKTNCLIFSIAVCIVAWLKWHVNQFFRFETRFGNKFLKSVFNGRTLRAGYFSRQINGASKRYGTPIAASAGDAILGVSIAGQAARFGIYMPESEAVRASVELSDGDTVDVGGEKLLVIGVPGHSRGGIALYSADGRVVFTGDSLFRRSIGRTDLPGGNHEALVESVTTRLLSLPDDTLVLPMPKRAACPAMDTPRIASPAEAAIGAP